MKGLSFPSTGIRSKCALWPKSRRLSRPHTDEHASAHVVLTHRSNDYRPLGSKTKALIKGVRVLQLVLRALELVGAAGILALYVLMTNVATVVAWMLRIAVSLPLICLPFAV